MAVNATAQKYKSY